jgi:hypothetical protein
MVAIQTKFLPATNHKGARVKAWCPRGSVTIGYHSTLNSGKVHAEAARQLAAKLAAEDIKDGKTRSPWLAPMVEGYMENGNVYVALPASCTVPEETVMLGNIIL